VFGCVDEPKRPDLAIEVIWTSGGIDKLEIYRLLDVPEVWIYHRGRIQPYYLAGEAYEAVAASVALPAIDLDQLVTFLDRPTTSQAIREYRAAGLGRVIG